MSFVLWENWEGMQSCCSRGKCKMQVLPTVHPQSLVQGTLLPNTAQPKCIFVLWVLVSGLYHVLMAPSPCLGVVVGRDRRDSGC